MTLTPKVLSVHLRGGIHGVLGLGVDLLIHVNYLGLEFVGQVVDQEGGGEKVSLGLQAGQVGFLSLILGNVDQLQEVGIINAFVVLVQNLP